MAPCVECVTVVLSWALQGDEVQRWHGVPLNSFLKDVVSEEFLNSLPGEVEIVCGPKKLQRPLHIQVRNCMMGGNESCLFLGLVRTPPSRSAVTSGGGQCDVDLPLSTAHRAEGFLAQFAAWMSELGFTIWTRYKEDAGNHLTPFWLYARMQASCPTKSQVQFGCTSFAAVNARTHAYARGKGKHLLAAVDLLQHFVDDVWTFEEQAQGDAEPTHAHQHDTWEEKQMRSYICPSSEQVWFCCDDDPSVWFMPDTPTGRRSKCGKWEKFQAEDGRVWWCCESSRHVFFPTAA
jgi:hypothetical protein